MRSACLVARALRHLPFHRWFTARHAPAFVFVALAGCGYSSKSRLPEGINTIAVPIFRNQTFRREIELELAQALRKEILAKTDLKLVDLKSNIAHSALEGEIIDFELLRLREDKDDEAVEYRVNLVVDVKFHNLRTGEVIYSVKNLARNAEFLVSKGEGIAKAREEAVRELSREIVSQVLHRW
ncbi:MAG: LPS assembly lipoprotein LptE [Planctomycetota bacterium]|nr:LPS assembly lipoprotein LptE [Planctomycetota bacterium]MDP6504240.1 LPS assembly lipoprotein LptE [Planctomycetota bacterium]